MTVAEYELVTALRMRVRGLSADARLRGSTVDVKGKRPKARQDLLLQDALHLGGADDDPWGKGRTAGGPRARAAGSGSGIATQATHAPSLREGVGPQSATSIGDDDEARQLLPLSALVAPQFDATLLALTSGEFLPDDNDSAEEDERPLGDELLGDAGGADPREKSSSSNNSRAGMVAGNA